MSVDGITVTRPDSRPYLVTGHKLYMIGSQDGLFPERGEHMPYEMWGIWSPPVKVLGGFWMKVNGELVQDAVSYEQLPYGAEFLFRKEREWELKRFQFVPQEENGFIVEASISNLSEKTAAFQISFGMQSNLMPVWLAERAGIVDGADTIQFDSREQRVVLQDEENPWTAVMECSLPMELLDTVAAPVPRRENEKTRYCETAVTFTLEAGEKKTLYYFISFSADSEAEAKETASRIRNRRKKLLDEKTAYYEAIDRISVLHLPGRPVPEEMYRWTKYINDWIIRDVEHVGKGVVAGYAEFPWWFGNDTNYIVPALMMQGEYDACKSTLRLVKAKSEEVNGNGRVVHEVSSNGVVYYEGMTTETPQFADTVWTVYLWSGDHTFLEEMYAFCVKGMEWLESICVDGLPAGYGISEIAGLDCFCCDTALLAVRGYEVLGLMAGELGHVKEADAYRKKKASAWDRFQKEFYLPEYGIYGDMAATKEEIIPRAETWKYTLRSFPITEEEKIMGESSCKKDKSPEDAREKARLKARMEQVIQEAQQLEDGERKAFYLFGLGHSSVAVELGLLEGKAAQELLDAHRSMEEKEHIAVENMMPIGVGRRIAGLGNIGRLKELLDNIQLVADGFGSVMPGATSEIYPGQGCFVQAWNSLATMWPYANSIFGIKPNAFRKKIVLKPCVGPEVNGIILENLLIGGKPFTFRYLQEAGRAVIKVEKPDADWSVELAGGTAGVELAVEENAIGMEPMTEETPVSAEGRKSAAEDTARREGQNKKGRR